MLFRSRVSHFSKFEFCVMIGPEFLSTFRLQPIKTIRDWENARLWMVYLEAELYRRNREAEQDELSPRNVDPVQDLEAADSADSHLDSAVSHLDSAISQTGSADSHLGSALSSADDALALASNPNLTSAAADSDFTPTRSEEHTSELQSH